MLRKSKDVGFGAAIDLANCFRKGYEGFHPVNLSLAYSGDGKVRYVGQRLSCVNQISSNLVSGKVGDGFKPPCLNPFLNRRAEP